MTRAYVNTDLNSMAVWIDDWSHRRKFSCQSGHGPTHAVSTSLPITLKATTKYCSILWQLSVSGNRTYVVMTTLSRSYWSILLNFVLLASLLLAVRQIAVIIQNYTTTNMLYVALLAGIVISLIRYKYHYLCLRLTALEKHFWRETEQAFDTEFMTRHEGQLEPSRLRFVTELLIATAIIVIGYLVGGIYGVAVSICLLGPFVTVLLIYLWKNTHLQWHWHFWIAGNMNRWIFMVLCVPALAVVLFAVEAFLPLELYKTETDVSIANALKNMHFRVVFPREAMELETDAMAYMIEMSHSSVKGNPEDFQSYLYFNSISLLFILAVAVLFFPCLPFISLLSSHKRWQQQAVSLSCIQSPSVPYLAESWNWKYPFALRMFVVFHWTFGGIINIAAVIFSVESLYYILFGKCCILPPIANLWSWVFAAARLIFGDSYGKWVGSIYVITACFPILFVFLTFLRRIGRYLLRLAGTLIPCRRQVSLNYYVKQVCLTHNIKPPSIFLRPHTYAYIQLYYLPLINRSVIEISQGAIELLSTSELKAAVAHEIGHLRQGPWRVAVLKLLSSLAFFPNYYLTICMDWAKKEMDADRFALEITEDGQSLKQALIKMSLASLSCTASKVKDGIVRRGLNRFITALLKQIRAICVSVDFFFGDGLFGYAHPYLSERLAEIDRDHIKE